MKLVNTIDERERERVALQDQLDAPKKHAERNRLGQFSTPTLLAQDILRYAEQLLPSDSQITFIDPAIGTGSFYSALLKTFPVERIAEARGFEIDKHYGNPAATLWKGTGLKITLADFTHQTPKARFNLLICNPPYVRHHHMSNEEKTRLQRRTLETAGIKLSGLAGLYCHFIGLSHGWLAPDAISGWLVPSEFMDVNYGRELKRYLLEHVTLLHVHRFDPADVQFADALVSSAVVWFRKAAPPQNHSVKFTFGGTLAEPHTVKLVPAAALVKEAKWTRFPLAGVRGPSTTPTLGEFFKIKRGLATGDNSYFILSEEEIRDRRLPLECFRPVLPSPRYVEGDEVQADGHGLPILPRRLFLLDSRASEEEIRRRYPPLAKYLDEGKARGLHDRYLCRHRTPWYAQEERAPAPIVCTYLGRSDKKTGRPFRFILNRSRATVANVYLAMYPTAALTNASATDPDFMRKVWSLLNRIKPEQLLGEGRVYGGGLHKLEPKELANVPVPEIAKLLPESERPARQIDLLLETRRRVGSVI